jgi:uncharacterized membrane protein
LKRLCQRCGYFVNETARFCNQCGQRLLPTQPAEPSPPAGMVIPIQPTAPATTRIENLQGQLTPPPGAPPPAELAPNIAAMLCYSLSVISGLIFLALRPYNQHPFVRFHAYQSVYFFFVLFILYFIVLVLSVPFPDVLGRLMQSGLWLVAAGGTIWLMYKSYLGVRVRFPYVGDLAEAQSTKL